MVEKAVGAFGPINCSTLARLGYPNNYDVLQKGLELMGWHYNISDDSWYPPEEEMVGPDVNEEPTMNDLEHIDRLAQMQYSGFGSNVATGCISSVPAPSTNEAEEADRRRYLVQQCIAILRQAYNIRHDAKLMAEIRLLIRNEKDELTDLLDEIK